MRIICLDIGNKTVGVAVSDPLGYTAQGITTIHRKNIKQDMNSILELCNEYNADRILAGFPKNMNGTVGPQAEKVIAFCDHLKKVSELPIEFWDERLTTVCANRAMLEGDLSRKKRKQIVDKLAAVFILQSYLDSPASKK